MEAYLAKLIRAGFKVAVCDQLEDPAEAKRRGGSKAVVRRDVVRVVTPGTLTEDGLLDARGARARPTSWSSIRRPGRALRSRGPHRAPVMARYWPPSTAP
jgi:DNA mismatch repair ATPase MutS